MSKFISIQRKILSGFFVLIFLFLVLFIFILFLINNGQNKSRDLLVYSEIATNINSSFISLKSIEKNIDAFFVTPYSQYLDQSVVAIHKTKRDIEGVVENEKFLIGVEDEIPYKMLSLLDLLEKDVVQVFTQTINNYSDSSTLKIDNKDIKSIYDNLSLIGKYANEISINSSAQVKNIANTQNSILTNIVNIFLLFLIIFLFAGVFISLKVSRGISRPLIQLKNISQEFSKNKSEVNFDSKIFKLNDEVSELAIMFDQMIKSIKKGEEDLKKYNEDLELGINEKTKEINSKVNQLERLNVFMVDRELKMVELKKRISELEKNI